MQPLNITLVAGPPGAGKTTWIQQQLNSATTPAFYLNMGAGNTPIDSTYLAAEVPELVVLSDAQLPMTSSMAEYVGYLELGFHIDLKSLVLPENMAGCRRVAVLPVGPQPEEWTDWADLVVIGAEMDTLSPQLHLWRSALTGQVLDVDSLNTVWYELTQGAYGTVQRAKGIFDVTDGRSLYFDFGAGLAETTYLELNLPRWLKGRPDRFSGIEVVGEAIDREMLSQTLKDCCLDESAIAYYQKQIQDSLSPGEEVA